MTQTSKPHPEPAPIGAPTRDLTDRLAEFIRRFHHGLMRPLWADLPENERAYYRDQVPFVLDLLLSVGVKVEPL